MQCLFVFSLIRVCSQLGGYSVADLLQQCDTERQRRVREEAGQDPGGHGQGEGERGDKVIVLLGIILFQKDMTQIKLRPSKQIYIFIFLTVGFANTIEFQT